MNKYKCTIHNTLTKLKLRLTNQNNNIHNRWPRPFTNQTANQHWKNKLNRHHLLQLKSFENLITGDQDYKLTNLILNIRQNIQNKEYNQTAG